MKRLTASLALLLVMTAPALAHAPIEGIGSFYNGLLHPLLVPSHLLILLGLGLLLGQHAPRVSRWGWAAFVTSFSIGLAAGQLLTAPVPAAALLAVALTAGLLVSLSRPVGPLLLALIAAAGGLGVGLDTAPDDAGWRDVSLALAGAALGGVVLLSYTGGLAAQPRREWHRIGVRVAGSWTAASAAIVLTFALAGHPVAGAG
jgi:hydrogenase/urease accessory protein HupE